VASSWILFLGLQSLVALITCYVTTSLMTTMAMSNLKIVLYR